MKLLRYISWVVITVVFVFTPLTQMAQPALALAAGCIVTAPSGVSYTVTICLTSPSSGSTLTGDAPVTATVSLSTGAPRVQRMVFYLNSAYLLTDYQSPYNFSLPTTKWVDGSYILSVEALMSTGVTTQQRASLTVNFNNGITSIPPITTQFQPVTGTTPPPGSPFQVVAAGDGASGETNAVNVSNLVASLNPNLFIYLGDVYEKGSKAEFYNWYGTSTTNFGRFRSITDPTVGNHEYQGGVATGYLDYWGISSPQSTYYSFNAGNWHFISLNSNAAFMPVTANSTEYNWLQQDLVANAGACTIVFYHHPLFNIGPEGSTTAMADIWNLLAQNGVKIVLNGHDHTYQRWMPLNGSGQPVSNGVTEFVVGSSGHGLQTIANSDSRVAFSSYANPSTFGALLLKLTSTGAQFNYKNTSGTVLDSGVIPCSSGNQDNQPPSVPNGLTASAANATTVNLSWAASSDNIGVAGYTIYRNGAALSTVSGTTLAFSDVTAQAGINYQYTIDAYDQAANHSALSAPVSITIPDNQPPSVPAGIAAAAANATTVNLSWTASNDNVGMAGYTIYRNGAVLNTVQSSSLSYSDTTVQPATTYQYALDAFDQAGNHSTVSGPLQVTTPALSSSLTFSPAADTYVNASSPATIYGMATTLRADGTPDVHSYLRFNVSGLGGKTVNGARLMIFANSTLSQGIRIVAVADNAWSEAATNFNNAPVLGALLANSQAITTGTWINLDVTPYVTGEGSFNFGIVTISSTAISLASRESGPNAPKLIIDIP